MFISCWSVKGGSGTTVTSVALAVVLARSHPGGALLVDLAGDAPAALGVADPRDPGLTAWLAAGPDVPTDAMARLELSVGDGLALLPRGTGDLVSGERMESLVDVLAADSRAVVVDCGLVGAAGSAVSLVGGANHSLLVARPCYLGLRRAVDLPMRPSGVVVVSEPGRALTADDVSHVAGAPVVAELAVDPAVARAVDAGLLVGRLPRSYERAMARVIGAFGPARAA